METDVFISNTLTLPHLYGLKRFSRNKKGFRCKTSVINYEKESDTFVETVYRNSDSIPDDCHNGKKVIIIAVESIVKKDFIFNFLSDMKESYVVELYLKALKHYFFRLKSHSPFFTRDPALLRGDRLRCQLVKSSRGLGFTIVGGDDNVDEFLQIKSVVPNGPAWTDGLLKTGDVLVYVNETCVLGFTHADMVSMFQSIQSGETVNLEVCRGYPLPFDPDDPNTEIVTTVAVTSPDQGDWANELERQRFAANSTNPVDVQSMPDLSANSQGSVSGANIVNRPGSADLLDYGKNDDVFDSPPKSNGNLRQEDIATVPITKGGMGFGFTIADSAYGQKVKKILDRPRCKTLQEGDILVEINGVSVRGMSHSEVVQVLKECSRGQEANITIQRGHTVSQGSSSSPIKNKYKSKKDSDSMKPKSGFLFRSKTPTAELYASASREKENLPNRPKTPIVDTRNMRSKTPTSLAGGGTPFQRNDITRASLGGSANASNSYYNSMLDQMNGMHMSNGQNMNQHQVDAVHHLQQQQFQRSKSPGNELENGYQGYQSSMQPQGQYGQYNGYQQTIPNSQQYNPAVEYNHQNYVQYPMPSGNPQVAGYPADTFQEPGYGYTSASGGINYSPSGAYRSGGGYRAGSLPRGNQNTYPNNAILARKESTSFEHSEPLPGGLTRWPRPERRPNIPHVTPNSMANTEWVEMSVALQRQDSGFGFRIVGGTEESSQVSIGHIVPDGAADVDGRLFSGDEIVAVDNVNVLNASHHQVVGLMGAAAQSGQVTITVRRRIYQQEFHQFHGNCSSFANNCAISGWQCWKHSFSPVQSTYNTRKICFCGVSLSKCDPAKETKFDCRQHREQCCNKQPEAFRQLRRDAKYVVANVKNCEWAPHWPGQSKHSNSTDGCKTKKPGQSANC
jgi:C-terminal processing protease CtpA/Prc